MHRPEAVFLLGKRDRVSMLIEILNSWPVIISAIGGWALVILWWGLKERKKGPEE